MELLTESWCAAYQAATMAEQREVSKLKNDVRDRESQIDQASVLCPCVCFVSNSLSLCHAHLCAHRTADTLCVGYGYWQPQSAARTCKVVGAATASRAT